MLFTSTFLADVLKTLIKLKEVDVNDLLFRLYVGLAELLLMTES